MSGIDIIVDVLKTDFGLGLFIISSPSIIISILFTSFFIFKFKENYITKKDYEKDNKVIYKLILEPLSLKLDNLASEIANLSNTISGHEKNFENIYREKAI